MSNPELLTPDQVAQALAGLPEWTGDTNELRRTAVVEHREVVLRRVHEAQEEMNHHADVDEAGNELTFTLSTHSAGGVTQLDVELARRIDDVLQSA